MNTEELERSLRTEFESYLKGVVAGMRQDVSDFQKNFEAEFEKHKNQLDEAFRDLSMRFESDNQFDQGFIGSVVEHLRLARDEGAEIAATAFGEAEKLAEESTPAAAQFDLIRDAINEISSKTSQSEILSSLVHHAASFTPRGAFFIVKNDHFVGWKVFGKEGMADEGSVREIRFPLVSDTIMADAINSLAPKESSQGDHAEDALFLEPLNFSKPDRMYAIPLNARGRGVAVLYADYGTEGITLNAEALETLVRVAGLRVELLAASQIATTAQPAVEPQSPAYPSTEIETEPSNAYEPAVEEEVVSEYAEPAPVTDQEEAMEVSVETEESHEVSTEPEEIYEIESFDRTSDVEPEAAEIEPEAVEEYHGEVAYEMPSGSDSPDTEPVEEMSSGFAFVNSDDHEETAAVATESYFEPMEERVAEEPVIEPEASYFETEAEPVIGQDFGPPTKEAAFAPSETFDDDVDEPEYAVSVQETNGWNNGGSTAAVAEPVVEIAPAVPGKRRFSDRNVDLPIEVADEERRLHNDARRFARLLVSEIKLYNEQKVTEGREAGDLYDRLRDAIDRSREMYAKRVQPPVASKFDYFHYELVNALAEGNDKTLGENYPGSEV